MRLPLLLLCLLASASASAQVEDYFGITLRDGVAVYASASPTAQQLDELNSDVVLLLLDDPRECASGGFVPVQPDPVYLSGARWSTGYVRCSDVRVQAGRSGLPDVRRPMPRTRVVYSLTAGSAAAAPVTFRSGAAVEIENVFGSGAQDGLVGGAIGFQFGAPTRLWSPTLGFGLEIGAGIAPQTSVFNTALLLGPTLGFQPARGLGLHLAARAGPMWTASLKTPDDDAADAGFLLSSFGAIGQATGALTVGSIKQFRLEAGYQYAFIDKWAYNSVEGDAIYDSGLDRSSLSLSGPVARLSYSAPLPSLSRSRRTTK